MKTKILFLHHGGLCIRGSEKSLLTLIIGLNNLDYETFLLCNEDVLFNAAINSSINSKIFQFSEITIEKNDIKIDFLSYIKKLYVLYKIIKDYKPCCVYVNNGLPSQLAVPICKILKIPIITHVRAEYTRRYPLMWLFKWSDVVIFVSNSIRESLFSKVNFKGNVKNVYNGIDTHDEFQVSNNKYLKIKHGFSKDSVIIAQVGSLIKRKGADILIKAFSMIKNSCCYLVFIGDGPARSELKDLVKKLNLEKNVLFLGEIQNIADYYKYFIDINVLASRSEAFGRTLIEASASGLPSIGSNVGGISEVIIDSVNGFLFEKNDIQGLNKKLLILINDEMLRLKFGENARNRAVKLFSHENYVNKISLIIMNTVKKNKYVKL